MEKYHRYTLYLLGVSTVVRLFLANALEFGNDEVYYWLYAKYPALSHFDHPGFVGLFIQFFTGNLWWETELAVRLAAVIPATIAMYVVFLMGVMLRDEQTGFVAVILYNLSLYGGIIAGTFILPDAPLVLFWLLACYFFMKSIPYEPNKTNRRFMVLGLFFTGCAMYSKYQAVFLLVGLFAYLLIYNREWLRQAAVYLGLLFPAIAIGLVGYWNFENDFISYRFHGDRVSLLSAEFNGTTFGRELLGQVLYSNPYVFVILLLTMLALWKKRLVLNHQYTRIFMCFALPLVLVSLYLSMFRPTLPHWSGVAYLTLIPLLAFYIVSKAISIRKLGIGLATFYVLLIVASITINTGWLLPDPKVETPELAGRRDALMDMYGWKQVGRKLEQFFKEEQLTELPIVSDKWFPAAHIDYYVAHPLGMKVYGLGNLHDIHKYYWINKEYEALDLQRVLYITDSRNFRRPSEIYSHLYQRMECLVVLPVLRNGRTVKNVFVYQLIKE